jgi:NitT/TauT family transport system substrate-binding protein
VGVKLGGNEELMYRAMMAKAGADTAEVKEGPVKFDIAPLLNGAVDVWPGYEINEVLATREKGFDQGERQHLAVPLTRRIRVGLTTPE